jgi:hypothetical protein
MTKVFIGGSRRVTTLTPEVRRRLDQIIENKLLVLVGDANGADKAVQQYLHGRRYDLVEVFCTGGHCRNNAGSWRVNDIPAPHAQRDFAFYEAKDREMTEESSVGLMLWDGKSKGTLANVHRLLDSGKKVVLWIAPEKTFRTLKSVADWQKFSAERQRLPQPPPAQEPIWR